MGKKPAKPSHETVRVPLGQLQEAPWNPMQHGDRNKDGIRRSLERYGQVEPLVVRKADNSVIGGNGRLQVMRELGWAECDVIFVNVDEMTAKAMAMALNKTSDTHEWDWQATSGLLRELQDAGMDLADTGFVDYEWEPLLQAEWTPPPPVEDADPEAAGPDVHHTLGFTEEQWVVVKQAIDKVRVAEDDEEMSHSRCIELVVAEWLAGK